MSASVSGQAANRSRQFAEDPHPRYWWHHRTGSDYVPAIYQVLTDDEWQLIEDWYRTTQEENAIGEINVPAMSMVQGLVSGSGLSRIVQLGHYCGYSTLLIGFWLRAMGQGGKLVSIDIDPDVTGFTDTWVRRAELEDQVHLRLCDSASADAVVQARGVFAGAMPQLVLLDSSHQYEHTVRELERWVPAMTPGSLMLLHDTSTYAKSFDRGGRGGVQKALDDFARGRRDVEVLNLNRNIGAEDENNDLAYADGCGLGLLQKR
jgi:predicted O-methyltransferase YrrM